MEPHLTESDTLTNDVLPLGIYRHYKGKDYRVHGIARHSETLDLYAVYEPLYDNPLAKLWIRPLSMFLEQVSVNGDMRPRFQRIESDGV
jgi:hypothetical protein